MNSTNNLSTINDVLDALEKDYIKRYRRRWRSVTDRILLLDILLKTKKELNNYPNLENNLKKYYKIESKILGSKNNEYIITITTKSWEIISDSSNLPSNLSSLGDVGNNSDSDYQRLENNTTYECSCPDFTYGKNICKHLYWFSYKFMEDVHPDRWNFYNIVNLINLIRSRSIKIKGRNDTCSICLEEINYDNENTICCIENCNNSVHQFCWNKYNIYNHYKQTCVICRSYIQVDSLYY